MSTCRRRSRQSAAERAGTQAHGMDFLDSLAVRRTFPALARTGPGNPGMEQRAIAVAPGSRDSVTVIWVETRP